MVEVLGIQVKGIELWLAVENRLGKKYVAGVFFSLQFFFLFHRVFSPKLLKSICVFNRKWFLFFQELRSRLFLSDDQ